MDWKKGWKWGIGGAVLGLAAVWAGRKRQKRVDPPQPIPEQIEFLEIVTEERPIIHEGRPCKSSARYHCAPTRFRVWSFLRRATDDEEGGASSSRIFHITPEIRIYSPANQYGEAFEEIIPQEKFYATLHVYTRTQHMPLADHIGRGRIVEFRKCHVGGSLNGVETGEKIVTMAAVADFSVVATKAAS